MTKPHDTITLDPAALPLLGAILALIVVPVSFVLGIVAALDGSGSGAGVFPVLFIGGLVLALAALVISIVRLGRGARKLLPIVTIVVASLPLLGLLALWQANLHA